VKFQRTRRINRNQRLRKVPTPLLSQMSPIPATHEVAEELLIAVAETVDVDLIVVEAVPEV